MHSPKTDSSADHSDDNSNIRFHYKTNSLASNKIRSRHRSYPNETLELLISTDRLAVIIDGELTIYGFDQTALSLGFNRYLTSQQLRFLKRYQYSTTHYPYSYRYHRDNGDELRIIFIANANNKIIEAIPLLLFSADEATMILKQLNLLPKRAPTDAIHASKEISLTSPSQLYRHFFGNLTSFSITAWLCLNLIESLYLLGFLVFIVGSLTSWYMGGRQKLSIRQMPLNFINLSRLTIRSTGLYYIEEKKRSRVKENPPPSETFLPFEAIHTLKIQPLSTNCYNLFFYTDRGIIRMLTKLKKESSKSPCSIEEIIEIVNIYIGEDNCLVLQRPHRAYPLRGYEGDFLNIRSPLLS